MTTTAKPVSALSRLANKTATAKPKTDDKPTLLLPPELHSAAKDYVNHSLNAKSETTLAKQASDQLTVPAMDFILGICEKTKQVLSSVSLVAGPVKLTFIRDKRYNDIPMVERKEGGDVVFGFDPMFDDAFTDEEREQFFTNKMKIEVKDESMTDDVVAWLMDACGDQFDSIFNVKRSVKVTEAFHNRFMTDPDFRERIEPLMSNGLISPYSASLRT